MDLARVWKLTFARPFVWAMAVCALAPVGRAAANVKIYAAEPVYADLARQIGGGRASVQPLSRRSLSGRHNGGEDSTGRPSLIVANSGAASHPAGSTAANGLEAARFAPAQGAPNPYYWYDVATMRGLAGALAARLGQEDPGGAQAYRRNLAIYDASLAKVDALMKDLAYNYRGSDIFVTDPLSKRIIDALHFAILDPAFARGRPSPQDVSALRNQISQHDAAIILIYDGDSKLPLTSELVALAKNSGVPTVEFRESLPSALSYQEWMIREIDAVHGALNEAAP
jgi:zinc/manganese transport system substrate-binding protein